LTHSEDSVVRVYRPPAEPAATPRPQAPPEKVREVGGRKDGTEPTRFGDWEKQGRCVDF
jgi:hypothetical protein